MKEWYGPLDPACPAVATFMRTLTSLDDPLTEAMRAPTDDIAAGWEREHRSVCPRCQKFGAANIKVR